MNFVALLEPYTVSGGVTLARSLESPPAVAPSEGWGLRVFFDVFEGFFGGFYVEGFGGTFRGGLAGFRVVGKLKFWFGKVE